ncbi:MAG: nitrogenase component 1 [Ruminococcus sp.]|jgi:nitrogenase iron protein NifH
MESHTRFEVAVYGKGGIGKSTVSANLSAALAMTGRKVMQIGCDPKHDSTRLLMHGVSIPTVLDYLKETPKEQAELSDVLKEGCLGIGCIEAGGPTPGVGCAGRGIISAFEFLKEQKAKEPYDIVLYDVLGDVVCGGFAVPVRREYADAVFLVTSGEYMAIYAANNILRGIRSYDQDTYRRVAGIIFNERKVTDEEERIRRFAEAVGLPVCARIPRSDHFASAEAANMPLMEMENCQEEQEVFLHLAGRINDRMSLYRARPLTDEMLEQVVLGMEKTVYIKKEEDQKTAKEDEKIPAAGADLLPEVPRPGRPPLYGCAFNGAATAAIHLTDALILAHSPKSCAFYTWQNISSPGRKNLFNRGILMPSAISPNFECTQMGQTEAVFGGMDRLKECVREALKRKPGAVVVISSCVSGIIGDDIRAVEEMSVPGIPVIAIHADGDIAGDYMEGIRMCMRTLAEKLIDPAVKPEGRTVNLINEAGVSTNRDINYRIVKELLDQMNIGINCRFLGDATCREMKNFLAAPLNILAADQADGREMKKWMEETYGCRFMEGAFPIGFQAAKNWLNSLGEYFSCQKQAGEIIERQEKIYRQEIEKLKPYLQGKRVFLMTINSNLDWILDAATAAGMKFLKICVFNYLGQEVKITDHPQRYDIDADFDWTKINETIRQLKPDLVLSNYTAQIKEGDYLTDAMPMSPVVGFHSGIHILRRWVELFQNRREGDWKNDRALFEKYYA